MSLPLNCDLYVQKCRDDLLYQAHRLASVIAHDGHAQTNDCILTCLG